MIDFKKYLIPAEEAVLSYPVENRIYYNYDDNKDLRLFWQYCLIRKVFGNKIIVYDAFVIQHQNLIVVIDPTLIMRDNLPFVMLVAKKDSPSEAWHKWTEIIGKLSAKIPPEKYFGKHKLEEHLKNGIVKTFKSSDDDMKLVIDICHRGLDQYYDMIKSIK